MPRELPSLLDGSAGGLDAGGCRVDRREAVGRAGHRADQQLFQFTRAREQNLALVGEVPEERSLRQSRPQVRWRERPMSVAVITVPSMSAAVIKE